jgi:hypothetical protein
MESNLYEWNPKSKSYFCINSSTTIIMKKNTQFFIVLILIISSCSTGKKALEKGDYFSAITKSMERLKSDTDNKKAIKVLEDGYPLALEWSQEEIDLALSSNAAFKWEAAINQMEQVNRMSDLIRSTPAARKIVPNPKSYSSELNMAYEKAAEARYIAGLNELEKNTRETARNAFDNFYRASQFVSGYKDVAGKMNEAKEMATLKVIVEAAVVNTQRYKLSSQFFYDQVFKYLNNNYSKNGFVHFFSPDQAEKFKINQPDFIVQMEFFDFSVGNLTRTVNEENLLKKIPVEGKDSTRIKEITYSAKLKTYTDEVVSAGRLNFRVIDFNTNDLLRNNLIHGSFTWVNQYAIFAGDKEALSKQQLLLTQKQAMPLPPEQDLFIEFTKPIYDQLVNQIDQFFRKYK